ncbi:MAG: hypothetical protein DUW69_002176 [Verrucomicrobia bacterium]|nr:MAG: hypothetical protein DUW69_002176 [Verrucomicrobiota bacterium]
MKTPRPPLTASLLALATLLLLAACEGPDRKELMNEIRHSVPPMAAEQAYFDGQIICRITLGSNVAGAAYFGGHDGQSGKMKGMKTSAMGETKFGSGTGVLDNALGGGMGGNMGGGMGGNSGGGASGMGGGASDSKIHSELSGTYQGNLGMNHIAEEDEGESSAARRAREAQMPPALLRMQLENPSAATVVVEIREVNSDLGNFAVRPDTVTLAPGQAVEVEPMQSLLGVDSYSLPVSIILRAGGQTQSRILTLRPVAPASGTPPPPAKSGSAPR